MTQASIVRRFARIAVALTVATLTAGGLTATASADASSDATAQLTATERAQLDRDVDRWLARTEGGKRTAVNQITFEDKGAVLTVPLPGEKKARTLDEPATKVGTCDYENVCLWEHHKAEGTQLDFYTCKFQKLRWYDFTNTVTSWENNQSGDPTSVLLYWDGNSAVALDATKPREYHSFNGDYRNDRADFLSVC